MQPRPNHVKIGVRLLLTSPPPPRSRKNSDACVWRTRKVLRSVSSSLNIRRSTKSIMIGTDAALTTSFMSCTSRKGTPSCRTRPILTSSLLCAHFFTSLRSFPPKIRKMRQRYFRSIKKKSTNSGIQKQRFAEICHTHPPKRTCLISCKR